LGVEIVAHCDYFSLFVTLPLAKLSYILTYLLNDENNDDDDDDDANLTD